jgi:quinol monooxygenase YgiN
VKPGQIDELIPFLKDNLPNVRGFKGNMRVSVFYDSENSELLLDEEWMSMEAHQSYIKFIDENGILGKLNSFLNSPPIIKYFTKMAI